MLRSNLSLLPLSIAIIVLCLCIFGLTTTTTAVQEREECRELKKPDGTTINYCQQRGAKFHDQTIPPLHYEAALLSNDVYNENEGVLSGGWYRVQRFNISYDVAFSIYRNDRRKYIGFSFQGTVPTINDWAMINGNVLMTRFNGHSVHAGFLNKYKNFQSIIHQYLSNTIRYDRNYKLLLTGHSQGGAVANICAYDLLHNLQYDPKKLLIVTFAAPRAGSHNYSDRMTALKPDDNYRYVSGGSCSSSQRDSVCGDSVSTVPPRKFLYKHNGRPFYIRSRNCEGVLNTGLCHSMDKTYIREMNLLVGPDEWYVWDYLSSASDIFKLVGLFFGVMLALYGALFCTPKFVRSVVPRPPQWLRAVIHLCDNVRSKIDHTVLSLCCWTNWPVPIGTSTVKKDLESQE